MMKTHCWWGTDWRPLVLAHERFANGRNKQCFFRGARQFTI